MNINVRVEHLSLVSRVQQVFDNDRASSIGLYEFKRGDDVEYSVNVDNVFYYGVHDSEPITEDNIGLLEETAALLAAYSGDGTYFDVGKLFAATIRKMRPQGLVYIILDPRIRHLFDEVGPVRPIAADNPFDQHGNYLYTGESNNG